MYKFANIDYDHFIQLTSGAVVLQYFVFYYWFRLSNELSQFVRFLFEVVKDIYGFLIMFIICILMFGNACYVMEVSRSDPRSSDYEMTVIGKGGEKLAPINPKNF